MNPNLHDYRVIPLHEIAAIGLQEDWAECSGWHVDFEPLMRLLIGAFNTTFALPKRIGVRIRIFGQQLAMSIFGQGACYG